MRRLAFSTLAALSLAGCAASATGPSAAPPVVAPVAASAVPPGMQFLYGSAEAAALSEQAFNALVDAMRAEVARATHESAILAAGATLAAPRMAECAGKPLAAVFDVDETVLLNLGLEYHDAAHPERASDAARLDRWERAGVDKVLPVPGARAALDSLRAMGVAVLFNTNRTAAGAAFTEEALNRAGLGPAKHLETLWLKGDVDGKSGKDGRRAAIAETYCVVALGGDQLGDFSDLFAGAPGVRRDAATQPAVAALFGRKWFVLPNPVYGSGLRGGFDDVFPRDKRWDGEVEEGN